MNAKTCRDCGNLLGPNARGCYRCAMNLEAENMIERFVWRFVLLLIVVGLLIVVALVFVRR